MKNQLHRYLLTGAMTILAALANLTPVFSATDVVRLYSTPGSQTTYTGNNVSVQIRVAKDSNSKVDYAGADIRFTAAVLEVVVVSRAGSYFNENNGPAININNTNGTLNISGSGITMPSSADVLLATVTFRVKSAGAANVSFTGASVVGDQLGGGNVKNALTTTSGSSIIGTTPSVASPTQTPTTPSPSSTSSPTTPAQASPSSPSDAQASPPASATDDTPTAASTEEVAPPAQPEDIVTSNGSMVLPLGLELWQLLSGGVIVLGLLGAGVFFGIRHLQNHKRTIFEPEPIVAAEAEDGSVEGTDEPVVALPDEKAFFAETPIPDPFANMVQDQGVPVTPQPAPFVAEPTIQPVVEGIAVEPLDPNMPSPLSTLSQPVPVAVPPQEGAQPAQVYVEPAVAESVSPVVAAQPYPVEPIQQQEVTHVESAVPVEQPQAVALQQTTAVSPDEDFPDMFEEGEARLRAEGLETQLRTGRV